jgi:hypothetical protein
VSTTNILNFDGQSSLNLVAPPDTNGAVGGTEFVQTVNITYTVYDKSTGAVLFGPAAMNDFWASLGGNCASGLLSDPIVLYDRLAGRWVVTEIAINLVNNVFDECVAVSTTSDALLRYNLYDFPFGSNLNDYQKVGVWPDAYYVSSNTFQNAATFIGANACAMDRTSMLAGKAATMQCFQQSPSVASLLPSDLDGATPPSKGEPNFFLELANTKNSLGLFKFHVDFTTPSNSRFRGPTNLRVAPFTEVCPTINNNACIPQPAPGELLEALSDRLMYRLAYRNFGTHESLVTNHTVVPGTKAVAGVRWYEIRNPKTKPFIYQQGTVVDPSTSFWMGSIAMDKNGDIALGFSASSATLMPSIEYVGRVPTDNLGSMESANVVINGTGVQENTANRWGDYSSMALDPSDDCTFWYTQEYYKTSSSAGFNWNTRIAAFKFNSCK